MENEITLKDYRAAIRDRWLKIVGRKKLKSHEYRQVEEWFEANLSLSVILTAIQDCAKRAREKNTTLFSLGVIKADIERVQRQIARMSAGAHVPKPSDAWRDTWRESLTDIIDLLGAAPEAEPYKQLLADLDSITLMEAERRFKEIK